MIGEGIKVARLLVVDDDEANRDLLSRQLTRQGHQVLCATGGAEALEKLKQETVDMVLLDVLMPDMNGYEVLDRIKNDPAYSDLPVVMVSALDEYSSVIRCIQRGADDYLVKPFDPILLKSRVNANLEKKDLRDQRRRRTEELEKAYQQGVIDSEKLFALQRDVSEASRIQKSILPSNFDSGHPELKIYAEMLPAVQMSGDFYDFFSIDEHRVGFVIGDVSGKGIAAAFFMAVASTQLRATALKGSPALECLQYVNQVLVRQNDGDHYVTLFYGILDVRSGEVEFAAGGHGAPFILRAEGTRFLPDVHGTMLGLFERPDFAAGRFRLAPGEGLFLYTDGFTEAADPAGHLIPREQAESIVNRSRSMQPEQIVRLTIDEINRFSGSESRADDITVMALRYLG